LHPRGTSGRAPWVQTLDLKLTYSPQWAEGLQLGLVVNNALDAEDYFRAQDNFEDEGRSPLNSYGQPRGYVDGRVIQFTAQYEFSL
jgi:outer membrane receptor protein involved in Fe transport